MLRAEVATGSEALAPEENGASHKEERRKVRPNNMVVYQGVSYGPLPEELAGETVRLRPSDEQVEVRADSGRVLATYPISEAAGAEESE
jgi:hypothetical protein